MRNSWFIRSVLLTVLFSFLFLASASVDAQESIAYQGNKARITVGTIKSKTGKCTYDMAAAIGEMLSTALANNDKFIVLASGEEVAELIDEIDFGQSEYVEEGRGPDKGLMEGADILITGAVTAFKPDAGGSGGGLRGLGKKAFGKIGIKTKKAEIRMDIKLIDIRTRRILKAKSVKAKSTSWGTDIAGGGLVSDVAMIGDLGVYSDGPMEDAIRTALAKMVELIAKEIPKEYYRYKGRGQYTQEYGSQTAGQPASPGGATASTKSSAVSAPVTKDMRLFKKYDFVPGNKVIFYDDLSDEEEGEFPYRWNLDKGVFEIVRLGKEFWIMCSDRGSIRPKTPDAPLPQKYTVELEFYDNGPETDGHYFYIYWVDDKDKDIGSFEIRSHYFTKLVIMRKEKASKKLPKKLSKGVHTMRIMATRRSIKCFIDNERVANVPKIEGFNPVGFRILMDPFQKPDNPMLIRNYRFAEGGKSMRDQLDEDGKIVTHGILFDPNAYVIKGESFKTFKEIARLFEDDPDLRLSIEGHTDSDGSDDHNLTLSQNRADAAKAYLISEYGISSNKLEAKGWGESKPIGSNDSSEGKANNRRVELVKI